MNSKNFFIYLYFLTACGGMLFSTEVSQSTEKMVAKKSSQPQYADESLMSQTDCSALSSKEQGFASQLSDANQILFCSKMTSMQRQKAMQMAGMQGTSGINMSPDEAVQDLMQNNDAQMNSKRQKGSGACPVQ